MPTRVSHPPSQNRAWRLRFRWGALFPLLVCDHINVALQPPQAFSPPTGYGPPQPMVAGVSRPEGKPSPGGSVCHFVPLCAPRSRSRNHTHQAYQNMLYPPPSDPPQPLPPFFPDSQAKPSPSAWLSFCTTTRSPLTITQSHAPSLSKHALPTSIGPSSTLSQFCLLTPRQNRAPAARFCRFVPLHPPPAHDHTIARTKPIKTCFTHLHWTLLDPLPLLFADSQAKPSPGSPVLGKVHSNLHFRFF
jgi:hypothetical protein